MFQRFREKRMREKVEKTLKEHSSGQKGELSDNLAENILLLKKLFCDVDSFSVREFHNAENEKAKFCMMFSDGVITSSIINEYIIKPVMDAKLDQTGGDLLDVILNSIVAIGDARKSEDLDELIGSVTYGDTLLFADGCTGALILNSKGFTLRATGEPESEKVLSGPREGFNESMMQNLSMLRRRVRSNELKIKFKSAGKLTKTQIAVCYIDCVVNKNILNELYQRLEQIDIDGILDSNYITEYISEASLLGFSTIAATERPDVVVAKLLEGRIALIVDGTPIALTLPMLFIENFQANEDYYVNPYYSSFSRILRVIGFMLTVSIPAVYTAIATHHHQIFSTEILITIATGRQTVPLPTAVEVLLMLLIFDIVRETGIRMPTGVEQTLSIVGALVIGQATVEAGLVAAPMIIIVAFTGITNLLVPKLNTITLFTRYSLLILAAMFGLFGVSVGVVVLITHIVNLQSFGVSQFIPIEKLAVQEVKDLYVRLPWPKMLTRVLPLSTNRVRAAHSIREGRRP